MSNKSMGSRKQQMVMRDELYVDRRIKIFEVKKKGPTFDVKKIAADLKAKSQKRMAHRQTKSDFINSIMLKTTVPVMKRRVVDVTPMETTTISSDEVSCCLDARPLNFCLNSALISCRTTTTSRLRAICKSKRC